MRGKNKLAVRLAGVSLLLGLSFFLISACSQNREKDTSGDDRGQEKLITIGFSQLGAESDWRIANTQNMKDTFTLEKGYNLIMEDGQQKQERQITAIRHFIQQEVDVIVLAPVTESGWDSVLAEARDAGIPVILLDRMTDTADESLYTAWVGSDFMLEGEKAAMWLKDYADAQGVEQEALNIVDIQGTIGASAQIGRTQGLMEAAEKYGWNIVDAETGDYTQTKSKEVMARLLKENDEINVVYCENDNEAFGAIEALEEAGKHPGRDLAGGDVLVMSFDATMGGLNKVLEGKIALNTECNPLQAAKVEEIIQMLEAGKQPEKKTYVYEELFGIDHTVATVEIKDVIYPVRIVSEKLIVGRKY